MAVLGFSKAGLREAFESAYIHRSSNSALNLPQNAIQGHPAMTRMHMGIVMAVDNYTGHH